MEKALKELIQYKGESMKLADQSFLWNCLEEMKSLVSMLNQVNLIGWLHSSAHFWKLPIELYLTPFWCLKETVRIIICIMLVFSRVTPLCVSSLRATAKRRSKKERTVSFFSIKRIESLTMFFFTLDWNALVIDREVGSIENSANTKWDHRTLSCSQRIRCIPPVYDCSLLEFRNV